jgi:hemerythrin-like metal-binding protein
MARRSQLENQEDTPQMPLITWNDKLSVGVKALDDDHKRMIHIVNELHDGIMLGRARDVLSRALDELVAHTENHFAQEEQLFAQTGYRGRTAHKKEHRKLTKSVKELQDLYKSGAPGSLSLETMNFLETWAVTHIQEDQKCGPHLNAKGIQ